MPQRMAGLTPLQARKQLLAATAMVQRRQLLEDLDSAGNSAREFADVTGQRLRYLGVAASVAAFLVAAFSSIRRLKRPSQKPRTTSPLPPPPPPPPRESLLLAALPVLRLVVTAWLAHRTGEKR